MSHRFSVEPMPSGVNARIRLDGEDISAAVRGYTINHNVNEMPTVLVRAPWQPAFDGEAELVISEPLASLLAAAGWTPPAQAGIFRTASRDHALHVSDGQLVDWCLQCRERS